MKKEIVSLRLPEDVLEYVEEKAEKEKLNKTVIIRMLVLQGIEIDRKRQALELYRQGKVSLGKAAKIADLTIAEMIDFLGKEGVGIHLSRRHFEKGLENLESLIKT
ncbi:MAG: UPF0175 family protein [Candidatus Aenigmarchaeota archaeon]|nr:UPF0175 family protein [Candidatus Aenigmarchaeota archaeon]